MYVCCRRAESHCVYMCVCARVCVCVLSLLRKSLCLLSPLRKSPCVYVCLCTSVRVCCVCVCVRVLCACVCCRCYESLCEYISICAYVFLSVRVCKTESVVSGDPLLRRPPGTISPNTLAT